MKQQQVAVVTQQEIGMGKGLVRNSGAEGRALWGQRATIRGESQREVCRTGKGSAQLQLELAGRSTAMLGRWIQALLLLSLGAEGVPPTVIFGAEVSKTPVWQDSRVVAWPGQPGAESGSAHRASSRSFGAAALPLPPGTLSALINVTVQLAHASEQTSCSFTVPREE